MQVFKAYLKVLNKNKGLIITYFCIFAGVVFGLIIPKNNKGPKEYAAAECAFGIIDESGSEISKELIEYLGSVHEQFDIKGTDSESILDEIYYDNIDCAIRIPADFEDKLIDGDSDEILEIITIPGTAATEIIERDIDNYLNIYTTYLEAGYKEEKAYELTKGALEEEVQVSLLEATDHTEPGKMYYFFVYLGWIFVVLAIQGIAPILIVFNGREIRDRINCSAYPFMRYNKELILGMVATGAGFVGLYTVLAAVAFKAEFISIRGLLYFLNMASYIFVSLSIAFLVSRFISKKEQLSLIANIISLGMAFLCGIFVPLEYLGEGVIKVAHFMPAYWYALSVNKIDAYGVDKMIDVLGYMGIEILFAIVFIVAAIIISKLKQTSTKSA